MAYGIAKRIVDIIGSLIGIALFSPVMLWASWKIKREMPGEVIFRQERAGLDGRPFVLYK
ncbi:MAG: sugar transferase, partial [Synergistaceae bacterium]|nr:sugar transferase [Synergistaceae bacterium]